MNEKETILIHPYLKNKRYFKDNQLNEAKKLISAINLTTKNILSIGLEKINSQTFINSGNIEKLKKIKADNNVDLIFMNCSLSPIQQRNLEKLINCKFIDRTGLILEIFGARAYSNEGKLQVSLASLEYQKSRLVRSWTHLERQRGGAGFMGGPGERQIESDRRQITEKINKLKKKIKSIDKTRKLQRYRRKKNRIPIITLVGYTNSGKSTLFNNLTKGKVLAKDMLFATLDSSIKSLKIGDHKCLLVDTVGFIRDLPTSLIAAFKSTLDEIVSSDLILHIRDISDDDLEVQFYEVSKVLEEIGVKKNDERIIEVFNKIDSVERESNNGFIMKNNKIYISATNGVGISSLKNLIQKKVLLSF